MGTTKKYKPWVAYLTTFPPRVCGIATFTQDLTNAIDRLFASSFESKIVAINSSSIVGFQYPKKVILQISQSRQEDYVDVARKLNSIKEVELVSIQHEFGIFGGEYGSFLISFLEELRKPSVITLHTIPPEPDQKMRDIVKALVLKSDGIIVMTRTSKEILKNIYRLEEEKISVIPHGIHPLAYRESTALKSFLGLSDRIVISTFGLMNRGKGIEYVIEALPEVIKKFPNIFYLIIGATHPIVLQNEGETYRNFLIKRVYDLGLTNHIRFYNSYSSLSDLLRFLESTDIHIVPSLDPNQAVSGTLSYALGSGRPVIATAFAQAREYITDEVGALVDFRNPPSITESLIKLLGDEELRMQMGKNAYFRTRHMIWPNIAISYAKNFAKLNPLLISEQMMLPPIKLAHLLKLTDDFGIIQFAKLTEPDISSGYTLDDNARALVAAVLYWEKFKANGSLKLIGKYIKFLEYVAKPSGYFENYVNSDRTIDIEQNKKENLDDSNARALYALARVLTVKQLPKRLRIKARKLFEASFEANKAFASPRAAAFYVKGLYFLLSKFRDLKIEAILRGHCDKLISLYNKCSSSNWQWCEEYLTYSNAILPEALLLGYLATKEKKYFIVGKTILDFLIKQTFQNNIYMPIGQSGWYRKGKRREYFDQQPEDVSSMIEALKVMYFVTNDANYEKLMYKAFYWFLGDNILSQIVYDRTTGGCYDGVGEKNINLNQGAESTVSYLLARFCL